VASAKIPVKLRHPCSGESGPFRSC
jgi:hypothetical protein